MNQPQKADSTGVLLGPKPGKESVRKYTEAFNLAREEFARHGITHPTGRTPGFRERVQEIYNTLTGNQSNIERREKPLNHIFLKTNNFNICTHETWDMASKTKHFKWKDTGITNKENGKDITEHEMMVFVSQAVDRIRHVSPAEKADRAGMHNIIELLLDFFIVGINADNAILIICIGINNGLDSSWPVFNDNMQTCDFDGKGFDIHDLNTWRFAKEAPLFWEGEEYQLTIGAKFTEIAFVRIMHLLFISSSDSFKNQVLINLAIPVFLNELKENKKITDIFKDVIEIITASDTIALGTVPESPFTYQTTPIDPRNPRTFRNATNNQLIIDGVPIFRYGSGENWTKVRKPVTEYDFVNWIRDNIKKHKFQTPKDREKYYSDYIQWYYDSNDMSKNVYGGFKFTGGMLELSSHLSVKDKEKIGNIFTELLREDPRVYRFQQALFDSHIEIDSMFFAKIALAASFQAEQDLVRDYFYEFEFESEKDAKDTINKSGYLNRYPELKNKIMKDAVTRCRKQQNEQ